MKFVNLLTCSALVLNGSVFAESIQQYLDNEGSTELLSASYFSRQQDEEVCCPPEQGEPLTCGYPAAYNAPAAIFLNDDKCFHNMGENEVTYFIDGSFTYWYAGEEGLPLTSNGVLSGGTLYYPSSISTVFQSFDYKPGFKVAGGLIIDHEWVLQAEYTWFRGTNTTNSGLPPASQTLTAGVAGIPSGTPVWVVNDWFLQGTPGAQAISGSAVTSKWHLAMDIVDLTTGRPYYQGPRLTIAPVVGLRGAWIRQMMTVSITEDAVLAPLTAQPIESRNNSNSWGIGPKFGLDANFLLPADFRVEGNIAASLLYTQYTSVTHSEDPASTAFNPGPYTANYSNYSCLRPIAELGLGLGWGMYLNDDNYHIDFSADYDFAIFWHQNIMRKLLDDTLTGTSPASSDLFYHGLTVNARFDF